MNPFSIAVGYFWLNKRRKTKKMTDKSIKSVRRVFEIFELFDRERRPLAAKEIAKQLGYPLTSAHALLKSMHELGYADFDPPTWCYTPSPNAAALLDWVRDVLIPETRVLDFVSALNSETKETINVSRRINTKVRIVYGMESLHSVGVSVKVGTMMPASGSLTGITSLANFSDADLSQFFETIEEIDPDQAAILKPKLIKDVLSELRSRGTVTRCDLFVQGIGAVCLPVHSSNGLVVVGVVGPSDRIWAQEAAHRRVIKRLAKEYGVESIHKLRNPRK